MLQDVARIQELLPEDRGLLVFSDATKLRNPSDVGSGIVMLKKGAAGYPLAADLYVKGPLLAPTLARQWLAVDADVTTPKNAKNVAVTTVKWRLGTSAADYWWNGAAWAAAPIAGQWNTLETIQTNIGTFPTTLGIRFIANLQTTDSALTPSVDQVRFLYRVEYESTLAEIVLHGLIAQIRDNLAPQSDMSFEWGGGTTIDLDTVLASEKEPLTIVDVYGVFNVAADPAMATNLKSAYDTATKVLTLTGSLSAGTMVRIRLTLKPSVMIASHSDYDEVARTPAVVVRDVNEAMRAHPPGKIGFVNRATGDGRRIRRPRQVDVRVKLVAIASLLFEAQSIGEALQRFILMTRRLHVASLDVDVSLVIEDDLVIAPGLTDKHLHEAAMAIRLCGVDKFLESSEVAEAVSQVNVAPPLGTTGLTVTVVKD